VSFKQFWVYRILFDETEAIGTVKGLVKRGDSLEIVFQVPKSAFFNINESYFKVFAFA
jgi:hypothetical protein